MHFISENHFEMSPLSQSQTGPKPRNVRFDSFSNSHVLQLDV
jgi:hypothetical protein